MPTKDDLSKGHTSLLLKASILVATAIVAASLSLPNPMPLFAELTASLTDNFGLRPAADQSTSITQATADARASPPPAQEAAHPKEIAASEVADQMEAPSIEPPSDSLFQQFQAWAAAQAHSVPTQAIQNASAKVELNAQTRLAEPNRAHLSSMQKSSHIRPIVHNARSEMPKRNPRRPLRLVQDAQAQAPAAQGVRAQEQSNAVRR